MKISFKDFTVSVDFEKGCIDSLSIRGSERTVAPLPLFRISIKDESGKGKTATAYDAKKISLTADGAIYEDFISADASVKVSLFNENGEAAWRIDAKPLNNNELVEWIDYPSFVLPELEENNTSGNGGKILFPYNEGALISDINVRESMWLRQADAFYPSKGAYCVFPNMICSQMIAYIWGDAALYVGAHDARRGVKEIDFLREDDGVSLRVRIYCGTDFGKEYISDYPIVFSVTDGRWEACAERYRQWFESALPRNTLKIKDNTNIPKWYEDSPLIVTYPVRGIHDMDEMKPNKLYPYTNALPILEQIKKATDSRLLVLLMHWEGTAPWAPPYVWPPYGGVENFTEFMNKLHKNGDMLGVYCSGFGYTIKSNLIAEYNKEKEYKDNELWRAMCAGPDGKVSISNICTAQRSGYDICPASGLGRDILMEAYAPLLDSELDYVQILDQNHGGGQYFCYSRDHGHAPSPGAWMTESMQDMLYEWNKRAGKTLFGCESAAAEPFIGNLLFSDNRYELNYMLGAPVPLYAYIYHEYVRNFMGNQVCGPLGKSEDTLRYRLAYSFAAGDSLTFVITEDGDISSYWGMRDFSALPDKEKALKLVFNLTRLYREFAKPYLYAGRMIPCPKIECGSVTFSRRISDIPITLPSILSSAWEAEDGSRALILVNPDDKDISCVVDGEKIKVPALNGVIVNID